MKILEFVVVALYLRNVQLDPVVRVDLEAEPLNKRKRYDGPRCRLAFSEIKLDWNPGIETSPFIELRSTCQLRPGPVPKTQLSNYLMVVLQQNPLSLAMVVNFEHFPHDGTKSFVVIGSPDVDNVDISTATPHLQTAFSRTVPSKMLPSPADNSYAVLILQDLTKLESKSFHLIFDLDRNLQPRRLSTDQIKLIANKAVDMVVLGETETAKLNGFEYFWSGKTAPMFSETWMSIKAEDSTMSLSMCKPDYAGFDAEAFLIKSETPGEENLCQPIEANEELNIQEYNSPDLESLPILHIITQEKLQKIRTNEFLPIWIEKCQDRFPKKSKILENSAIQKWITFEDPQQECKFSCKTCQSYLEIGIRPDVKARSKIITTGYLSPDIYENGNSIKNHIQSPLHQESVEFYRRLEQSVTNDEVDTIIRDFESKERKTFNATMNLLLIVYAEMKAGLSFQTHETLMKAIRTTGVNIGTKHHTDDTPPLIAKVLAKSFHHKLLTYLITTDQPFSIMIDSSTSFNMPFLAVYIQVLEDRYPTSHFYSLVHMEAGEAAFEMSQYFVKQIRKDNELAPGFENYFKLRIVAFSSDGAAVMTGGKNSFKTYLDKYVGRNIPNIVCLAHKLDSAYKQGIKPDKSVIDQLNDNNLIDRIRKWQLTFFETFEQSLNELYTFYSSRGYKKWMHFLETAEELDIETKRMKYIWAVRWSESHYRANETIHQMLYALLEDLRRMCNDNTFDSISRQKADQHYKRMTDKTYLIVLHDFLDILSTFKIASKKFQESASTLVGKAQIIYDVLKEMDS